MSTESKLVRELRGVLSGAEHIYGPLNAMEKAEAVIAELEATQTELENYKGRMFRLERAHVELLAAFETETGKVWNATEH